MNECMLFALSISSLSGITYLPLLIDIIAFMKTTIDFMYISIFKEGTDPWMS